MQPGVWKTQLSDVGTTDREGSARLGQLRYEGGKIYQYVKIVNTTATVAGAAGDPVAWDSETGAEDYKVVVDLSDADNPPVCAGFLMGTVTGTSGTTYYGWIQKTGPLTTTTTLGGSAGDGHPLYLTTTDKTLAKAVEADSAGVYKQVCAIANDASAKKIVCAGLL